MIVNEFFERIKKNLEEAIDNESGEKTQARVRTVTLVRKKPARVRARKFKFRQNTKRQLVK